MKKAFFNVFIIFALMFFMGTVNVLANSYTVERGPYVHYDGTSITVQPEKDVNHAYPNFVYKHAQGGVFICATGFNVAAPKGTVCTLSNETIKDSIGIAYLINQYTGTGGVTSLNVVNGNIADATKYYWTEVSVLYYTGVYASNADDDTDYNNNTYDNFMSIYSTEQLSNGKTMAATIEEAKQYQQKYSDSKYTKDVEFSLSETSLKFSLNDDGYYYSQKVYITDKNQNSDSTKITTDNSKFTLIDQTDSTGRYFQLKIAKSEVSANILKVNVFVTGSYEYYTSNYYKCENEVDKDIQDLFSLKTNKVFENGSVTISGEVSSTRLVIRKTDETDQLLPDVVIKVENEDKTYSQEFTTTDKEIVLEDLEYGKYTITEVSCPDGYVMLKEPSTVTLSKENLSQTVTIQNKLTRVEISKILASDGKLLAGAVLQIQDKDGNVIKDSNGKDYEWTSKEEVYVIEGLLAGTYYLVEKSAPEGYELNKNKIEFIIDDKTEVVEVEMKNNLEVKVPDTLSSRSTLLIAISMFDIALGIGILTYVKKNKTQE